MIGKTAATAGCWALCCNLALDGIFFSLHRPHGFWTLDGDTMRWVGVVLCTAGGVLRLVPVFVLGRRFSGLVAIQSGHQLETRGVYGYPQPELPWDARLGTGMGAGLSVGVGVVIGLLTHGPARGADSGRGADAAVALRG